MTEDEERQLDELCTKFVEELAASGRLHIYDGSDPVQQQRGLDMARHQVTYQERQELAATLRELVAQARPAFPGTPYRKALDKAKRLLAKLGER